MSKVIFTMGLQGSGKTSTAKEFIKKNPTFKRVNRDSLRLMFDDVQFNPKKEKFITKMENTIILETLKEGKNLIIDNMNLNPKSIPSYKKLIEDAGFNVEYEVKDFTNISVEDCVKNDLKRENSVGSDVIYATANKYLETIDEYIVPEGCPDEAYIFDIDGSLALMNGRSPFEWDKVDQDICRKGVALMAKNLFDIGYHIIVVSGRDSVCRSLTKEWLDENRVPCDELFMRGEGDCRKDTIIKKEIFDNHIKDRYNVRGVFDDRPSVIRMWKRLGLTVFNVDSRVWESEF